MTAGELFGYTNKEEILSGNIYRLLIKLGLPLALSEMVQILYDLANVFWLGRLGKDAVAAPSASWPFIYTFIAAMSGLLASGTTLVSQYRGAGDNENANKSSGQVFFIATVSSIFIASAGITFIPFILKAAGIPSDVLPLAVGYSRIFFLSILFISIWESFRAVVSASGDTITPMKYNFLGVGLNALLDPFVILGLGPFPSLGVIGAAISTLISRIVVSALSIKRITNGINGIKLELRYMKPDKALIKLILKVGSPLSLAWVMEALGFSALTAIISMEGSVALAAWGIGDRPMNLLTFATIGFIGATGIIVGQSLGAGLVERATEAVKKSFILVSLIGFTGGTLFALFGEHIARFFIDDFQVIYAAKYFYLYMGLTIVFFQLIQLMSSVAQGSGHTKFVMVISILRIWIIRNLLAFLFGPGPVGMGIPGIWLGMSISNVISGSIASYWMFKGKWKKAIIK